MSIDGVNSTPRAIGPGAANRLINLMGVHRGQSAHGAAPVRNSADIPDTVVPAIDAIDRDSLVIEAIRPPVVDTIQFTSTATSSAGDAALPPAAHAAVDPTRGSQPGSTASHPWDPRQAYAQGAAAEPSRAGPAETASGANAASAQTGQTPANSATGQTAATPADQAAPQVTPNTGPGKQVELTAKEQEQVERLVKGDAEIRRHEEAHVAAAGSLRVSGPHYEYATGPDGQRYAIAGVVNIDTTPVKGDPEATIAKMQQVRRAALAPESPSAADRAVARQASRYEAEARRELAAMAGLQSGEDSDQTTGRTSDAETTGVASHGSATSESSSTAASASSNSALDEAGVYARPTIRIAADHHEPAHEHDDARTSFAAAATHAAGPSRLDADRVSNTVSPALGSAVPKMTPPGMAGAVASIPPGYQSQQTQAGTRPSLDLAA